MSDDLIAREQDRHLRALSAELLDRLASDHLFYSWQPHPKQLECMLAPNRIRCLIGANRTGKSEAIHKIAVDHLEGWSPTLTKHTGRLITYGQPRHIWVSALDANVSRDVSEDKIRMFIPPESLREPFPLLEWRVSDRMWRHRHTGSSLGFKTAESGRDKYQGTSRQLIVLDEEHPEEVFNECYARTIDCGGLILMGFTALKALKWLHKLLFGSPGRDIFVKAMGLIDNPHIPVAEVELAKKQYSGDELRIRVYGEFILRIGAPFFPREDVEAQLKFCAAAEEQNRIWKGRMIPNGQGRSKAVKDEDGKLKVFVAPRRDRYYAVAGDVSGGSALGDYSCIQVLDATDFKQVAVWHGHIDPSMLGDEMVKLGNYYNTALLVPEVNNHGNATLARIERLGYGNIYRREQADKVSEDGKIMATAGWYTDRRSKPLCLNHLKDHLREHAIVLHDRDTVEELRLYGYLTEEAATSGTFGLGAVAGNDDRVMALALAIEGCYQVGSPAGAVPSLNRTNFDVFMEDAQGGGSGTSALDFLEQSPDEWDEEFD